MDIVIVNTQPVPSSGKGAASVNRILSYTKGLIKQGNNVRILSTASSSKNGWQEYETIPVKHLGREATGLLSKAWGYLGTVYDLISSLNKEKKDVVLFVTSNYGLILLLELYCKITRTKIVNERSEFPFVLMSKNKLKQWLAPIYTNTAYKMLDGMIIMTDPLMDYYKKKAAKHCKFLKVPMTVDASRFVQNEHPGETKYGDYVAYCGNMGGNKDGLSNLLKAFSIVEKRGYPLNLVLIGGANSQDEYKNLRKLNDDLGNKNVVFYGTASREVMPALLKGAKILALARPSSLQSTGGFPTKLGEYLSTGNPVVVTAVGDIPVYLKDNENAFVVQPDDVETFADKLCYVWDNYDEAVNIGRKGQELALTVFSGDYQAKNIESFLAEIIN